MDIRKIVNDALFEVKYDEMVVVKDIAFFSLCEHHMLPFFGKCTCPICPEPRCSGSARSRGSWMPSRAALQIQERLAQEVAQSIQESIDPVVSASSAKLATAA